MNKIVNIKKIMYIIVYRPWLKVEYGEPSYYVRHSVERNGYCTNVTFRTSEQLSDAHRLETYEEAQSLRKQLSALDLGGRFTVRNLDKKRKGFAYMISVR